ncbi:hydroxyisourate hydrolase [Photobacterium sanctipauli]|uniref:5-hydroxyisourate hydrolase n=1 Tax=Photobacterium sanctipauli TaxID=1342794 RepID=A0A2T3NPV8_9GAMM|nr:hydroxyisourate hydrolase [Photobacterium sanctipauli]PSW18299.1 hydroxyisourate hydrolase [Photobacterium sanctipauli]
MGRLTTHVLDTANGLPGAEIPVELYKLEGNQAELLCTVYTNADGRTDKPLLADEAFKSGKYQLIFHTADYFRQQGVTLSEQPFLDDVVIRFGINDTDEHYHVPLLVSPFSFSTYRGS